MSIDKGEYLQFAEAAVEAVDALRGFQRGLRVFGHNLNSTATQDERTAFIAFVLTWWKEEGLEVLGRAEGS